MPDSQISIFEGANKSQDTMLSLRPVYYLSEERPHIEALLTFYAEKI